MTGAVARGLFVALLIATPALMLPAGAADTNQITILIALLAAFLTFVAMLLANMMFMAMGLYAAKLFARISLVPGQILWPIVFALSMIGAYALSSSLLDVWIALIFGVIGFLARRYGFSVAPIAVGPENR